MCPKENMTRPDKQASKLQKDLIMFSELLQCHVQRCSPGSTLGFTQHINMSLPGIKNSCIFWGCVRDKLLDLPVQLYPWGQGNTWCTNSTAIYSWLFKTQAMHSPLLLTQAPFVSLLLVLKTEEVVGCKDSSREISYRFSIQTWDWVPSLPSCMPQQVTVLEDQRI